MKVPRHPKKGVASQFRAKVQGAMPSKMVRKEWRSPSPEKVLRYVQLARLLLEQAQCTQKQAQVVGGGFVYFTKFR